jgi:hypothetical protein
MHVLTGFAVAFAAVAGLHTAVTAHDPPGTIFPMWQWPASHLPVLDGDLSEWQVIPEEFWFTAFDLNDRVQGRSAQPDIGRLQCALCLCMER